MKFYWLVLGVLCVWRVTHLLNAEDGPGDILVLIRRSVGNGLWGALMDCFYCLSLWIAVPFALLLGQGWRERLLLWPALSAGAILVQRVTAPMKPESLLAFYVEHEEKRDA
jgi:hypothetical protein